MQFQALGPYGPFFKIRSGPTHYPTNPTRHGWGNHWHPIFRETATCVFNKLISAFDEKARRKRGFHRASRTKCFLRCLPAYVPNTCSNKCYVFCKEGWGVWKWSREEKEPCGTLWLNRICKDRPWGNWGSQCSSDSSRRPEIILMHRKTQLPQS